MHMVGYTRAGDASEVQPNVESVTSEDSFQGARDPWNKIPEIVVYGDLYI
jgi:hypothetical protein